MTPIPLVKQAARAVKVFHYTEFLDQIKENGLSAPAALANNEEVFKSIIENYKERIQAVYTGEITVETTLDYLDYVRALLLDQFQVGRNMIFFAFQKVPKGISKRHDRFRKNGCVEINLTRLAKDKELKYVVVELPIADVNKNFEEIDLDRVEYFTQADTYSYYDEENADGLLFATIPHLAVWVPDGHIEKKYLTFHDE